jgi:trimethylamine:corrinoid methyltransferase-like protein
MKQVQAWVQVLSDEELQLIHRSSTRLLERLGVRMPHADCLAACRRAGAQVDEASETVRLPASLLEDFLRDACHRRSRCYHSRQCGWLVPPLRISDTSTMKLL